MKPSYEELQSQIDSLTVDRDHWRQQSLRIAAQVEVLRRELQSSSDWLSAYWDNLNAEQRYRLKQMDSVAKSTPAACLAQVRAEAAESLLHKCIYSCEHGQEIMTKTAIRHYADQIRQEVK